jgi:hypothetical protein
MHLGRFQRLAALVVLVVATSACGLRTWVDVTIEPDSTGMVMVQLASDQALRDGLATFSPDVDAIEQLSAGLAARGWAIEASAPDGEWEGIVATHAFSDLAELEGLVGEAVQGAGSAIDVSEDADEYQLSAELAPPQGDANQNDLIAQAAEVVDLDGRLSVQFPGTVTATNGEISEDTSTVTWTYDEQSLTGLMIEATAEKPRSGPIVVAVVVAALAVLAGLLVLLRRRSSATGLKQ